MARTGNNHKGGRPLGSTTKPRLSDFMSQEDINAVVTKALEMAKAGNEAMMKLIIEQNFGKAMQPVEGNLGGAITITFDSAFNEDDLSSPTPETT